MKKRRNERLEYDIFFFFKQKTAYEIKECDWSSDVCSSDLTGAEMKAPISFEKSIDTPFPLMNSKMLALESQGDNNEIGRASCRERV